MATPCVLVGRMIEQRGEGFDSRNGHGSGMIRFFVKSSLATSSAEMSLKHLLPGRRQLRERIARLVRPGLKMHCLSRADADQDSQRFHTASPLRQR